MTGARSGDLAATRPGDDLPPELRAAELRA